MLYFMLDGTIYFSETATFTMTDAGEVLHLDGNKTCIIKEISDSGFKAVTMNKVFGRPEYVERPTKHIAAIQKIGDNELLIKLRASLSGIIIAEAGNPSN